MYKIVLTIDDDILDVLRETIKQLPTKVAVFVQRDLKRKIGDNLLTELQTEPGSPHYPLRWASERQRRFVMRKLRRDKNLPYKRTGKLVAAWYVDTHLTLDGGIMEVVNPSPVGEFVFGDRQQPFHADTGWYKADDIILKYSELAQDALIDFWYQVTT